MSDETIPTGAVSSADDDAALASQAFGEGSNAEVEGSDVPAAEPVQDDQGDASGDAAGGAEGSIESLEQLAEALGTSVDEVLKLKAHAKIDGEDHDATLADIIKSYQLEGHVNKKSIELSEQRKAFETETAKMRQEWQQRVGFASQVLDSQEAQLTQQYQSVNWQALAQQDPAQYSALMLQFQQANGQIQYQKQALSQHYQQTQQQMREQLRPRAAEAIRAKYPELADPVSYGNALAEMKAYLKGIGANESNFDALELDPVVFSVARDAARYAAIVAKQPAIKAKLKDAPRMEKPSSKDSFGAKQARMNALRKRADSGDESAVAELLFSS